MALFLTEVTIVLSIFSPRVGGKAIPSRHYNINHHTGADKVLF